MAESFICQMMPFAGSYAMKDWAFCDGGLVSMVQFNLVYFIVGTTYGGDGVTMFALPDLRGRSAMGAGAGPNLPTYTLGQKAGAPSTLLGADNLPSAPNVIKIPVSSQSGTTSTPGGNIPAVTNNPTDLAVYNTYSAPGIADGFITADLPGKNEPINIVAPCLAISWLICMAGIYAPKG